MKSAHGAPPWAGEIQCDKYTFLIICKVQLH